MTASEPAIREATRADLESFFDRQPLPTLRGWLGEIDGRIVGMGGYAHETGRWIVFCDIRDDGRKFKKAIVRAAKLIVAAADRQGIRYLYAQRDEHEKGSLRWLNSLGFVPVSGTLFRRANQNVRT